MLVAVDTNVLARAIVDDGSRQSSKARRCLLDNDYFVSDTVLLETEWLLRSIFRLSRIEINQLFARLVASDHANFRKRDVVAVAVMAHLSGMDFADAMHIRGAEGCSDFVTFDSALIKDAGKISAGMVIRAPK